MADKNNIKEELKALDSPLLAQWQGKANEWSMPDGYLEQLTENVIQQPKKTKLVDLMNKTNWRIAASVLFLLATSWFFIHNKTTTFSTSTITGLDHISTEAIQSYVLNNIDEFDVELLENYALDSNEEQLQIEDALLEDQLDVDLF